MSSKIKDKENKYLIIGAGNVGTSLFRALDAKFPGKVHLFGKQDYSHQNSDFISEENYTNYLNPKIVNSVKTIIICVQDDRIKEATRSILLYRLTYKNIFHTSGAKDASELEHLENRGAYVASIHPMQSFAQKYSDPKKWNDIILAFQGNEKCLLAAKEISELLKTKFIKLNDDQKVGLHVAGVMVSNYLVALLSVAENIIGQAGIDDISKNDILQPLINGVVENYKNAPADKILSGPIKRGDINVLRRHIQYLQIHKTKDSELYLTLAKVLLNNPKFHIPGRAKLEEILDKYGSLT
ncbi:MAG: DUF2520 domain-containing protein [Calditrichaeota bacterium]|nr:MAG: DUF2520 domain-containing protein [Calditrichota bacterium]MBL1205870.1 DUF2520 domain-containing protein [Calditrichota bacterium]NOG45698.1 DUF2520 domain-containing protein [Calditrichota bacterium]